MTDEHVRKIAAWLQAEAVAEREAKEAHVGTHKPGSTERVFISREHACALAMMGRGR